MTAVRIPEAYRRYARLAEDQGWIITNTTGSNHLRWQPPAGRCVFTPSSPSKNKGGIQRVIMKLRHAGLVVPK